MKKIIVSTLFSIIVSVSLFAQNATLSGVVLDENNEPLYGANVVIDAAQGWASATDFDGKYSISVPAGTYYVLYKHISQENIIKEITLVAGESKEVDVSLAVMENELEQVVISATKRGITLEKEVVSVEVLSSDLLESNNINNGAEAVDRVPGVTVLDGQASIRGGSGYAYGVGSRVILVIDEIPLLSPERSEILWDFLPMENVESMEVVKGASSVQYGASALNGIINVNTDWPSKKKETEITMFSTFYDNPPKEISEAKWWEYTIKDYRKSPHELGLNMVHRRKLNEEMDFVVGGTMHSNQTHIESQSIHKIRNQIKWRWRPLNKPGLSVGVGANTLFRNKDVFFIWEGYDEGAYKGQSYKDKYIRMTIDPTVKYFFNEKNTIKFLNRVYVDKRLDSEYYATSIYNDIQYGRTYEREDISGGVNVGFVNKADILRSPSFKPFSEDGEGTFKINNLAFYGQSNFSYKDLTLTAGARFDWITIDGETKASKPVFNTGASYKFNRRNVLRFNFGQSFRVPGIAERFVFEEIAEMSGIPIYAGPNPEVEPESGYSIELGYKRVLKIGKWQGMVDAAVFYQDFNDMTEFVFDGYQHPVYDTLNYLGFASVNIADAKIFGWEVSLNGTGKIRKVPVTILAGYTYNFGADAEENPEFAKFGNVVKGAFKGFKVSDEDFEAYYNDGEREGNPIYGELRYRFRHTVKLDLSADFGPLTLGTNMRYYSFIDRVDEIFASAIDGISQYRNSLDYKGDFVVDARLFYNANDHFKIGLIVKNVFNNDYQIRPAKPDAPRTFTAQAKVSF